MDWDDTIGLDVRHDGDKLSLGLISARNVVGLGLWVAKGIDS